MDIEIGNVRAAGVMDADPGGDCNWTKEMIMEAQRKDVNLRLLHMWLIEGKTPSDQEIMLAGVSEKFYWLNRGMFMAADGLIMQKGQEDGRDLLVVAGEMKEEVMRICHSIPSAAHQAYERTKMRVKGRYFWHRMSRDIKEFVSKCSLCNRNKPANRKNRHPQVINHAGIPMEKIHMDFIGPLPLTKQGNEYILVMVDNFTKWIE